MTTTSSLRSPKNKFRAQINLAEAKEFGSAATFTANSIDVLKALAETTADGAEASVQIFENKAEFPTFDWQLVESYTINAYTYDVYFNDECDSNNKGMTATLEECREYIRQNNGTNDSYFADYKGGIVSIVCNETGETVYEEEVI